MNYHAFTNDSLTMMYEGVRGALAAGARHVDGHHGPRDRRQIRPRQVLHEDDVGAVQLELVDEEAPAAAAHGVSLSAKAVAVMARL